MRTVPVLTGAEAAQLIADSAVITVSSSSGLGCPDAVLEAIGQRYEETGSPANLTTCTRSPPATCTASKASIICADLGNCGACWPAPTPPAARSWIRR